MKYTLSIIVLLFFVFNRVNAQERYREPVADSVKVDTYTYAEKEGQVLDLDLYQPAFDGDNGRPVLVYVHGGGFSGGARDEAYIREFCRHVATYGYVVASVSYRLTRKGTKTGFGCDCPAAEKMNTFHAAVEDLQDATYFLVERREQFAIDPHKIILAGSSAGAETVLNTAFQPPYCYGLDSGPVSYAGVISMAGAVPDTSLIYEESAVPALLFHGTGDRLVPYATAAHHYCDKTAPGYLVLNGAYTIAERLKQLDKPYWLYTVCGAGHEVNSTPMTKYFDDIMQFCYDFVLKGKKAQMHTVISSEHPQQDAVYDFCATENDEGHE
jgi:acetyl esterase/lipase